MNDGPPILRPIPHRKFDLTSASTESSSPPTPARETSDLSHLNLRSNEDTPPSRTRSVLNLTASTLVGIYSPSSGGISRDEYPTPWGTGAQTPARRRSIDELQPPVVRANADAQQSHSHHHLGFRNFLLPLALRTLLLFAFGAAYGIIISHLHDNHRLAPVKVEGFDRSSWRYLIFWGIAGVGLGSLLPWVDILWDETLGQSAGSNVKSSTQGHSRSGGTDSDDDDQPASRSGSGLAADWNPVVRSIGAFVGIAFAIRKLPWQSTLQVSLTLALVNPVLWYLVDRSKPGFFLSAMVGIAGTAVLLGVNPEIVPSPATPLSRVNAGNSSFESILSEGLITNESIGVSTWIASVLFCSCVCFGNIGRRLALGNQGRRPSIV